MQLDDFVGRFLVKWSWGGGGDDGTELVCPWCEQWRYEMPGTGTLADVLAELEAHMKDHHR